MYNLDRTRLYGRELEIEFARGDRKSRFKSCCSSYDIGFVMSSNSLFRTDKWPLTKVVLMSAIGTEHYPSPFY